MQKQQFSIQIKASREAVWNTLWNDETFRDWASIIDEGTYMVGELIEGNEIKFISSVGGYGVTSLVEKFSANEFVSFKQIMDTKEYGEQERKKEWAGGTETYSLTENSDVTTLTLTTDVPPGQEDIMKIRIPKALERVKELSEI